MTTVGEMIAHHHFYDALRRSCEQHSTFKATAIGRAFLRWESLNDSAIRADEALGWNEARSAANARRAFDAADKARQEFLTLLAFAGPDVRNG